eukprot:SAG22_NODE_5225_length_1058_cov_0.954119_1_plen_155_part_00
MIPFHKLTQVRDDCWPNSPHHTVLIVHIADMDHLTQWLTYSLIEPFDSFGAHNHVVLPSARSATNNLGPWTPALSPCVLPAKKLTAVYLSRLGRSWGIRTTAGIKFVDGYLLTGLAEYRNGGKAPSSMVLPLAGILLSKCKTVPFFAVCLTVCL